MLTRPDIFANFQTNTAADRHVIVKIDDGATVWLFSDVDIQLTDGHVYPLVTSRMSITQSIDIYTRKWRLSDVTIVLNNTDYLGTGATLSDELGSILGATVTVYLSAGGTVTALSDCLVRFVGVIAVSPAFNLNTVTLRVTDLSKLKVINLPQNQIDSVWPAAPVENRQKLIPLVYGDFTYTVDSSQDLGLAIGVKIDDNFQSTWVIGDHPLHTITNSHSLLEAFVEPSILEDSIHTTSDSGRGTIRVITPSTPIGPGTFEAATRIRPVDNFTGLYTKTVSDDDVTNFGFAIDGDSSLNTFAEMLDHVDEGAADGDHREGHAWFAFDDHDTGGPLDNEIGEILPTIGAINTYDLETKMIYTDTDLFPTTLNASIYFDNNTTSGVDQVMSLTGIDLTTTDIQVTTVNFINDPPGLRENVVWHWKTGTSDITDGRQLPTSLYLEYIVLDNSFTDPNRGDGITLNETLVKIYDVRLKIRHRLIEIPNIFMSGLGRKYGSWVAGASAYSEGDAISDPAGIVESILIDEVGLTTADIDEASFVAAESSIASRINFHDDNQMDSNKAIRQIAEQSTFAFIWSAEGKARLIDMSDTTPATATRDAHPVVIRYSHIKGGQIRVSKEPKIYNKLTYKSRWTEERNAFIDITTVSDTTSDTTFGTRHYERAKWPNVAGDSATSIGTFLIGADGIWSNQHNIIDLETVGYTGADIQIGDWFEIDPEADVHIKLFGSSWSGKQFLAIGLTQLEDSTKIKGIELFG